MSSRFRDAIEQLKKDPVYSGTLVLKTCDQIIQSAFLKNRNRIIKDIKSSTEGYQPVYSPYELESNLDALNSLIEATLGLRKSYNDLFDRSVRQALELEFFDENLNNLKSLEKEQWMEGLFRTNILESEIIADKAISSGHPLAAMYVQAESAKSNSLRVQTTNLSERNHFVEDKWKKLNTRNQILKDMFSEPGHALNYKERAARVASIITENIEEIEDRLWSANYGLMTIFGKVIENIPSAKDTDQSQNLTYPYLDKVLFWTRDASRYFTKISLSTDSYEHTIYLNRTKDKNGKFVLKDLKGSNVATVSNTLHFSVDLTGYFKKSVHGSNLRVKGVALSIAHHMMTHENHDYSRSYTFAAKVFPPEHEIDDTSGPFKKSRKPVVLDNVRSSLVSSQINYHLTPAINNIDPTGVWDIRVAPYVGFYRSFPYGDNNYKDAVLDAKGDIDYIALHLLIDADLSETEGW